MQIRTLILIVLLALLAGRFTPIFAQSSGLPKVHAKISLEAGFGRYLENVDANVACLMPYVTLFVNDSNPRLLLDAGGKVNFVRSGEDKYGRTQDANMYQLFMNLNWRPFGKTFLSRLTLHGGAGIEYSDVSFSIRGDEDTYLESKDFSKTSLVWNAGGKFVLGKGAGGSEWYLVFNSTLSDQLQSFGACEYALRGTGGIGVRF